MRIWPNGGNPQNQTNVSYLFHKVYFYHLYIFFPSCDSIFIHLHLAVLATYIGDEFLALYHFVRNLAVKEPFPDAWNNFILLFGKVI
jgi:hypothetical protein